MFNQRMITVNHSKYALISTPSTPATCSSVVGMWSKASSIRGMQTRREGDAVEVQDSEGLAATITITDTDKRT